MQVVSPSRAGAPLGRWPELLPGVVHIWIIKPDPCESEVLQLETLSLDECERAQSFRFARDRSRFVNAHTILRQILTEYLKQPNAEIQFRQGPHGKWAHEAIAGNSINFNMARSADAVAYAFSCDREVGIDIERIRSHPFARAVVDLYFSAQERALLSQADSPEFDIGFLETWTRKEAYLKAVGCGLSTTVDLGRVDVSPGVDGTVVLNGCAVRGFRPNADYVAAIAATGTDWKPTIIALF